MAGMLEHCDFQQQQTAHGEDGRLRPDLVVRLPGGKQIVVDAKAPLDAFLDAQDSPDDETRTAKLQAHARQGQVQATATLLVDSFLLLPLGVLVALVWANTAGLSYFDKGLDVFEVEHGRSIFRNRVAHNRRLLLQH